MKTRLFKVLNFFAFNILFFALYLNFIHEGSQAAPVPPPVNKNVIINASSLERPVQYLEKASAKQVSASQSIEQKDNSEVLKLYFN